MLDKLSLLKWFSLSFVVIGLDQITKAAAEATLKFGQPEPIWPFLNFTLLYNTGAAFSFLADAGGWQRWFLIVLAVVVCSILLVWLVRLKPGQTWLATSLSLILGGAISNVIDRIIYGHVIDFIDFYYQNWHWPAFNIADTAISIGAMMLLLEALKGENLNQP